MFGLLLGGVLKPVWDFLKAVPWQVWLCAIAVGLAFLWHRSEVNSAYKRGGDDEKARIEQANEAAKEKADEAERDVRNCDGEWSRELGKCLRAPTPPALRR